MDAALLDHIRNHGRPWDERYDQPGCDHCAVRPFLATIHDAWFNSRDERLLDRIWALQDGYGVAGYTPPQGFDWSGIRDSSPDAIRAMHKAVTDARERS